VGREIFQSVSYFTSPDPRYQLGWRRLAVRMNRNGTAPVLTGLDLFFASEVLVDRGPRRPKFNCPVTALSLTTPTVSRDFIHIFSLNEHTFPAARESRLGGCVVSPASPLTARAGSASSLRCCPPNISSVTIDQDELCELPVGRRAA